jgi:hypothetical protein
MLEEDGPEVGGRLREMHDLYAFLERELPTLLMRWELERKEQAERIETLAGQPS